MRRRAALATALSLSATLLPASGEEVAPIQAVSVKLGDVNGVAYYTVSEHGYHLVATLAGGDGASIRFETNLQPGQKVEVSISGAAGTKSPAVEFTRVGDRLLLESRSLTGENSQPQ
jgi:hypothetical protein